MDNHADHPARRSVYYDDSCVLCDAAAKKIRAEMDADTIGSSSDLPSGITKEALVHEMHAMDENGNVFSGVEAIVVILRWHPRWYWLAPVVAFPGIKQAVALVYRIVARNRYRWFGRR